MKTESKDENEKKLVKLYEEYRKEPDFMPFNIFKIQEAF